ncbi:nascent polypeptide-associated complex protein [Pyrofollis japonicus]|uniref:nascent polypeptide-associated complex protein n=1 Tax=Pyrofollis japonicus TaxID=3060460 RepID=UPI00295A6D25|nr:nascent polypeptide-associated complex protein [Pyrofollis japonicus]BEP18594.1 nascent polypeptide-associated complex protein [Pyrofollis japonicus]
MFRFDPKELRKQLKRLGLRDVKIEAVNAEEVVIHTAEGKELVIISPQVLLMRMKGGAVMLQVMGQGIEEREIAISEPAGEQISEEDARFVAEQTGVSIEEAKQALQEAGGDIAAAIMLIEERKRALEDSS